MQNLTHDMENVFSEVRNGNIKIKSEMIDVLFQCLDALEGYTNNIRETSDEGTEDNENIIKALNDILNGGILAQHHLIDLDNYFAVGIVARAEHHRRYKHHPKAKQLFHNYLYY